MGSEGRWAPGVWGQEGACLRSAERQGWRGRGGAGERGQPGGLGHRGPGYEDATPGGGGSLNPLGIGGASLRTQKQVQYSERFACAHVFASGPGPAWLTVATCWNLAVCRPSTG